MLKDLFKRMSFTPLSLASSHPDCLQIRLLSQLSWAYGLARTVLWTRLSGGDAWRTDEHANRKRALDFVALTAPSWPFLAAKTELLCR